MGETGIQAGLDRLDRSRREPVELFLLVLDAVADGTIAVASVEELVLITAVWVDPSATDADLVFENNRAATAQALRAGQRSLPPVGEVLAVRDEPINGYYVPATLRGDG